MPAGIMVFMEGRRRNRVPCGQVRSGNRGCRYRAGSLPQTEFFVGLPEKTAMIRQGKRVWKKPHSCFYPQAVPRVPIRQIDHLFIPLLFHWSTQQIMRQFW